jgi:N-acetylmuramoyl-L-alanine amidase
MSFFLRLRFFLLPASLLLLASCQGPSLPGLGGSRSTYGDRPGPKGFTTVIVDAGHGGKDPGARARGLVEKQLALDIARRLKSELSPQFKVVLMRSSDRFVELDDRVRIANRYSDGVLVSVHLNYGNRRRAGPETYYWRTDSYALAKRVQQNLSATAGTGSSRLIRRRLRLTRNPSIPCLLVECGYLTNARDAGRLSTASYRARVAGAIARAIRAQAAQGDAGMGSLPRPIYAPPSKASDARG